MEIGIALILLVLGYSVGSIAESRHYTSIREREKELLRIPLMSLPKVVEVPGVQRSDLVAGSVVVSLDHFKRMLATLRAIFGGRVGAYETLVDRARREALLRMKEKAKDASMIVNVRVVTSRIGENADRKGGVGAIEAIAFGTAIWQGHEIHPSSPVS